MEKNTMTTTQISLKDQLVILSAEQYQAVFALYGQAGLDKYDTLAKNDAHPETIQTELATLIEKDDNQEQKNKITALINKYFEQFNAEKAELDSKTAAAKTAIKAKDEFKKAFNGTVATFTKEVEGLASGKNKEILQQRKLQQEANAAWEKREKIRLRGKKAYLRGLVAAVIDECEKEYSEEVAKEAKTITKVAKTLVANVDNPKSEKGTKEILKEAFHESSNTSARPLSGTDMANNTREGSFSKPILAVNPSKSHQ